MASHRTVIFITFFKRHTLGGRMIGALMPLVFYRSFVQWLGTVRQESCGAKLVLPIYS